MAPFFDSRCRMALSRAYTSAKAADPTELLLIVTCYFYQFLSDQRLPQRLNSVSNDVLLHVVKCHMLPGETSEML